MAMDAGPAEHQGVRLAADVTGNDGHLAAEAAVEQLPQLRAGTGRVEAPGPAHKDQPCGGGLLREPCSDQLTKGTKAARNQNGAC